MLEFQAGDWEGVDGLGAEALEALRAPAAEGVLDAAMYLAEAVRLTLGPDGGDRTGRSYKVSKRGPLHVASAPGEPPAVLFGQLRRSITHTDVEWDGWQVSASIGTNVEYARRLEFGGIDSRGVRILPRPYFEPTVLVELPAVEAMLEHAIASASGEP